METILDSARALDRAKMAGLLFVLGFGLSVLSACGDGGSATPVGSSVAASDNSNTLAGDLSGQLGPTMTQGGGVMELTIDGIGSKQPRTEVKWIEPSPKETRFANKTATKMTAQPTALPQFLDVAAVSSSTLDIGGIRYIAATIKVRNAPQCPAVPGPGNCTGYTSPRLNTTFMAVLQNSTINGTAVSRFNRFNSTAANPALTTQLRPAHGLNGSLAVNPDLASMQVFTESEVTAMTPDAGVLSIFPYGFTVRNVNDNSRVLPANPAPGQYDGIVTFGFQIPVQPLATDDPFKISLRFQTINDGNRRFTQSAQEQTFAGDIAATNRALALTSADLASFLQAEDLVVMGSRVAQTPIGNPICRVRTAGTSGSPDAYLVDNITLSPRSAPFNLSFVDRNSSVSIGYCINVDATDETKFVLEGSQSGRRKVGGSGAGGGGYGGSLPSGGASGRRNQFTWDISGQKPFFPGEEVRFTLRSTNTSGATTFMSSPLVGSFRIKSSVISNTLLPPSVYPVASSPRSIAMGDVNGDGRLDIVSTNDSTGNVSVLIGDGFGGFAPAVNYAVGAFPIAVVLGDFNGDGRLDILTANNNFNHLAVLIGDGAGSFGTAINTGFASTLAQGLAVGDVDGDGRLDAVVPLLTCNCVQVLKGNGAGGFMSLGLFPAGSGPSSVALGDLNGDLILDIAVANDSPGSVTILLGMGSGGFTAPASFAVGGGPRSITLGDLNNDGKLDIVTANRVSNNVSVLLGDGAGGFAGAVNTGVGNAPNSVVIGDVSGDGRLDVAVANAFSSSVSILRGNGAGSFDAATNYPLGGGPSSLTLGDVNGDGRLDVAATRTGATPRVEVMLGL